MFTVTTRRDENGGTQSLPIEHPQERHASRCRNRNAAAQCFV